MRRFTDLYIALDRTTRTAGKVQALVDYFRAAPPADAAWALAFLAGNRPKRAVSGPALRSWAGERAGLPAWLVDECVEATGDQGECLALLLPEPSQIDPPALRVLVEDHLLPLTGMAEDQRRAAVAAIWDRLDAGQRLVWHKLIGGGFRVGVSKALVVRALAEVAGLDAAVVAHRLAGSWQPTAESYRRLIAAGDDDGADAARPYPFFLANPLHDPPESLGERGDWQVEWKWDGIRGQIVRRAAVGIWSRGDGLVGEQFPELAEAALTLPVGTVLDGEILAWAGVRPRAFADLQRRLGRKHVSAKLRAEVPLAFVAYDLLEADGADVRGLPLDERRARLASLIERLDQPAIRISPVVDASSWVELAELRLGSRERGVEGFMLKRRDAAYGVGRTVGPWWKWKIDPHTVDAVLVYAQAGNGIRAGLFTDYTFAVWDDTGALVPVAKAYSGLTREEIAEVDRFVRAHTTERFGPVRAVEPTLVFELAFEGIQASPRHKSGVAVRFPRIARWRRDKSAAEADTLGSLRELLAPSGTRA